MQIVIGIMAASMLLLAGSTYFYRTAILDDPFWWIVLVGLGAYIAYIPVGSMLFERLIACFKYKSNAGFLIYIADAMGYVGSILVMLYQTISVFFAHFSHANIKMPLAVDKAFSYIFVTPHFHKIHHHYIQPHTDSNYGNIFSIWDHVFRTATSVKKMDDLVYGIDTHMKPEEHSSIKNLLMIPFQAYRPPVGSKFSVQ